VHGICREYPRRITLQKTVVNLDCSQKAEDVHFEVEASESIFFVLCEPWLKEAQGAVVRLDNSEREVNISLGNSSMLLESKRL
jgi:hypothetical protein